MSRISLIDPVEWDRVAVHYSHECPSRDFDSVSRNHMNNHYKKMLTGSSNFPKEIKLTKYDKYTIGKRVD